MNSCDSGGRVIASAAVSAIMAISILGGAIIVLLMALLSTVCWSWHLVRSILARIDGARRIPRHQRLAIISHEMRTPLNSVVGFARLLAQEQQPEKQNEYRALLQKNAELSLSIFDHFLDSARLETGRLTIERQPVDLRELIGEVQAMLAPQAEAKGLRQITQVHREVPGSLLGDPLRLRRVLSNLIGNAIKFTERGSVVVHARLVAQRHTGVTVKIAVTDTGIGLSRSQQKKLFTAFTQMDRDARRRALGAGLGLAICKQLVIGMGGEIGLISAPGEGSTFWFTWPAERHTVATPAATPPAPSVAPPTGAVLPGQAHVLVVDDDPASLKLTGLLLERASLSATACHDGQEALAWFARQSFDLVFMDQYLPILNGLQTLRKMRAREGSRRRTPIIVLSAHITASQRRRLITAGADDCLDKPLDENQLRHSLQRWLPRPRRQPSAEIKLSARKEPPTHSGNSLVIDPALAQRRAGRDSSLADELFAMLLGSLAEEMAALENPACLHDRHALLERVHRLHGATRCCGTPGLEDAAGRLEQGLRENTDDRYLQCLIARLRTEIHRVQQAAKDHKSPAEIRRRKQHPRKKR